jgi:hypothetical protein
VWVSEMGMAAKGQVRGLMFGSVTIQIAGKTTCLALPIKG